MTFDAEGTSCERSLDDTPQFCYLLFSGKQQMFVSCV